MTDRAPHNRPPKIVCAGGAVQDMIMRVGQFPKPGEKVQASEFIITSGGQAGNAAVAMARLGRPLRPNECVHHENGDKTDNRPSNNYDGFRTPKNSR